MIQMRHDPYDMRRDSFAQNITQLVHTKHYSGLQIRSHQIVQQPSVVAARNERPQTR